MRIIDKKLYSKIKEMVNDFISISDWNKRTQKEDDLINFIEKKFENKPVPGNILKFSVADGYGYYLLIEYNEEICILEHLPICDGYKSPAVTSEGKIFTETVDEYFMWKEELGKIFQ